MITPDIGLRHLSFYHTCVNVWGQRRRLTSHYRSYSWEGGAYLPIAFSHAGPAAWNSMPEHIRAEPDIRVFRKLL